MWRTVAPFPNRSAPAPALANVDRRVLWTALGRPLDPAGHRRHRLHGGERSGCYYFRPSFVRALWSQLSVSIAAVGQEQLTQTDCPNSMRDPRNMQGVRERGWASPSLRLRTILHRRARGWAEDSGLAQIPHCLPTWKMSSSRARLRTSERRDAVSTVPEGRWIAAWADAKPRSGPSEDDTNMCVNRLR